MLQCEDFQNGDSRISEIHDGEMVVSVYVNRNENTITEETYSDGNIVSRETTIVTPLTRSTFATPQITWTPAGNVVYNYYSYSGALKGTHTVEYKYRMFIDKTSNYDLYGEYKSLASLAGIISTLFGLGSGPASSAAKWLLNILGISSIATIFIPSNTILNAEQTDVTWSFMDTANSNTYCLVSGSKYYITDNDHHGETFYDSSGYFDPALFRQRDITFATTVHEYLYNSNRIDIVRWIDAI